MNSSRNIYKAEVDFAALALQHAGFNKHVSLTGKVNFSNPEAVKQLTKALLARDFSLSIDLLDDRLCPPVPNRFNYVLWLQDIIDQTSSGFGNVYDKNREVIGLDIGTGSSAIYPLLAVTSRSQWRMLASDIDMTSHAQAAKNIQLNGLESRIKLLSPRSSDAPLVPLDEIRVQSIDFVMTNPPFYSSQDELLAAAQAKERPPNSACTGAEIEMVHADGGEVGFVRRMIDESCVLRARVQWYSSMLGRMSSITEVVKSLRDKGCTNWCITSLVQGSKTRRWAVAWSWSGYRPWSETARSAGSGVEKLLMPFPCEVTMQSPLSQDRTAEGICSKLAQLDLQWSWNGKRRSGIGIAGGNVWSRAARRKQAQSANTVTDSEAMDEASDGEPALAFKIRVRQTQGKDTELHVRWLAGQDSVLFESFCGMLKREIAGS